MVVVFAQQPVGGEPQIVKRRADAGEIISGFRGQSQCAVLPDEQTDSEFFLEPPDLMADGGLGDVQLGGRNGEAQMPGRGLECAQTVERGQPRGHFGPKNSCMKLSHLKRNKVSFVGRPEQRRYWLQQD